MSDSKIQWTEKTLNLVTGCTKFSKECDNCYAEGMTTRLKSMGRKKYAAGFEKVVCHPNALDEIKNWNSPTTAFVNSMADLFHKDVPTKFIQETFEEFAQHPQHTFLVLTKRAHRLDDLNEVLTFPDNVWIGVSVGLSSSINKIKFLVNSGAKHKFLSVEPLLEKLDELPLDGIEWVIVGGESGPNARPMKTEWVQAIKEDCLQKKIPFFFKQWGSAQNNPDSNDPTIHSLHRYHAKGGCLIDGQFHLDNPTLKPIPMTEVTVQLGEHSENYLVMDSYAEYITIWELKSALPFPSLDQYNALKNDIKEYGMINPIIYLTLDSGERLIVEGHTRLRIAQELKLQEIPSKQLTEQFRCIDEVKLWMIRHQLQRRNLTTHERVRIAYKSKDAIEQLAKYNQVLAGKKTSLKQNGNQDNNKNGDHIRNVDTHEEIAKIAGVGRTTVVKYTEILKKADGALIKKLNDGKLTIGGAHKQLKDAKEEKPDELHVSFDSGMEMLRAGEIDWLCISTTDMIPPSIKVLKGQNIRYSCIDQKMTAKKSEARKYMDMIVADFDSADLMVG